MNLLTGDLGPTATYTRREYVALVGLGWADGRDATVWFNHWTAKRRHGTRSWLSRYAVSEVVEVGSMGRAFVWDKEMGDEEHGQRKATDRKPPYTVRVDHHGEVTCQCQADACHAPTCRHADMTLILIDADVFTEQLQGV